MVDSGQEIPLRFGSTVVGADPSCDVPLDAPSISGRHAQFDVTEEGVVTVTDLESSNGTYVGDVRIKANTPTELRAGDELALSKRLRVVLIARDLNA